MYSNLEIILLGAILISMAYFTLKLVLDKPKLLQYFILGVNMPLYLIALISLVLMLFMPLSSGYFLMSTIFRIMLVLLFFAELTVQAILIYIKLFHTNKYIQFI